MLSFLFFILAYVFAMVSIAFAVAVGVRSALESFFDKTRKDDGL